MNYLHPPFPFAGHAPGHYEEPIGYEAHFSHPALAHPMNPYVMQQVPMDLAEYYQHAALHEEYDEYAENLSRPRLTKEQVETLEAQFQAHPKPNSNTKRQLAVQTNLTLPRVANWFQNRRAKAKQQKRQEEFERMQARERGEPEKSAEATESETSESLGDDKEDDPVATPTQAAAVPVMVDNPESDQNTDRGEGGDAAQKASYESLQRALNAARAARNQFVQPDEEHKPAGAMEMNPTISAPQMYVVTEASQNGAPAFSEWGSSNSSAAWSPSQSPETTVDLGNFHQQQLQSVEESLQLESPPHQTTPEETGVHQIQYPEAWHHASAVAHQGMPTHAYRTVSLSTLPEPMFTDPRRDSCSDLAHDVEEIGMGSFGQSPPDAHDSPERSDGGMWKRPERSLDIAARRKRPRPAAIGTTGLSRSYVGPSSMSPTTRMPSFGAGHGVRHAKSTQNLGSRYAGVRKASTALRSPLSRSNLTEAGAFDTNNQDLSATWQSSATVSTTNLAPPTPLTPEEFRKLLPGTPSDSQFCLSQSQGATTSSQLFPCTQPMQVNIASPPATPLTMDMISQFQYQSLASAPPQCTTFPEFSNGCSSGPMTGPLTSESWSDVHQILSPDGQSFQPDLHMPRPTHISPITYDQANEQSVERYGSAEETWSHLSPSMLPCLSKTSSVPSLGDHLDGSASTEFLIQEFPEQQEAHKHVAQQLRHHAPKNYIFANQTLNDF